MVMNGFREKLVSPAGITVVPTGLTFLKELATRLVPELGESSFEYVFIQLISARPNSNRAAPNVGGAIFG